MEASYSKIVGKKMQSIVYEALLQYKDSQLKY